MQTTPAIATDHELQVHARTLGAVEVSRLTGEPQDVVSRWMNGGINVEVAAKFRKALNNA